ncbi:flagellin [Terrarubrum flagellatum]|uniref:flagellin n=1 Tax=Terrirubrum flagellatum TaxID=2895980 RepID=UPI003144F4DD
MTMRVATFALNDKMLSAALRTQAKTATLQLQEASGQISEDYGGLGSSAKTVLNLQASLARSKTYSAAADEANGRVEVMYDALSSMTDLLSNFRADLVAAQSGDANDSESTLIETAKGYLEDFASLMNTQYEGRYLFAGSATTSTPVDVSGYSPTDVSTADGSYYRGDSAIASVQVSGERTISYGVTGDSSGFEQALRALALVANAATTLDSDTLQSFSDLVASALDNVTATQSKLSLNSSALQDASSAQANFQDFASSQLSDKTEVDVAAVTVQLTSYETQLQASYSAIAKIQSLSILDYLK